MPVKFKPTQVNVDRKSGKRTVSNFYMHQQTKETLVEELNRSSTRGLLKQKIRNELTKRGVSHG